MSVTNGREAAAAGLPLPRKQPRGIVVSEGRRGGPVETFRPRIAAFVWGGRVQPAPTLPFGRWGPGSV